MAAIMSRNIPMGQSQMLGPAMGLYADKAVPLLDAMACRGFGERIGQQRCWAPRDAQREHREVATRVESGLVANAVLRQMVDAAVASLPWWAGTARFAELPACDITGEAVTSTDPRTGASCRASLIRDHRGPVLRLDWQLEPVHAPGTWTSRKRHARYRRGRESVRPRHRRSQ